MTPALRRKLGKLLPLLGSDKSGEVAAAAQAIVTALKGAGLDLHDHASAIGAPTERKAAPAGDMPQPAPRFESLSHFERRHWLDAILAVDWLTALERDKLIDIRNRVHLGVDYEPPKRLRAFVNELMARAAAKGVRA